MEEHEDLLVMLAQTVMGKQMLAAALFEAQGPDAVQTVHKQTQQAVTARFGIYIDFEQDEQMMSQRSAS